MRDIRIGENIEIVNPPDSIMRYCVDNLVVDNPEYQRKLRMNKWVGKTPKQLKLYETHGSSIILPFGCLQDVLDIALAEGGYEYSSTFGDTHPVSGFTPEKMKLFDYQDEAVNAMMLRNCGILQSPAGSGKTQCGIAIIQRMGLKALWLTHTHDLLEQSRARAMQYMDSGLIGTISEGSVSIGEGVTFATVQTMVRMNLEQYKHEWDVIIVDEVHRVAGSPTAMTMFSKVLNSLAARYKYGLSATVHRADGMIKATFAIIGKVVHVVPDSAVADRVMTVTVVPVQTGFQTDVSCLNYDGTLNYSRLISCLAEDSERNRIIAEMLIENADHHCLILSERLIQLENLMALLPKELQAQSALISGKMTSKKGKAERQQSIDLMRTGEKRYLFATYQLAKEGLDIPVLDRLFLVSPQKDSAVITQSIGRIARVCDGKEKPIAYDFVDKSIYCQKAFKKRCTTYRKDGCVIV